MIWRMLTFLRRFSLFLTLLIFLIGCQPEVVLPTQIPVAVLPEGDAVVPTAVPPTIPGTFTPSAADAVQSGVQLTEGGGLLNGTETAVPFLPTITPFVTVGPATRTRIATQTPTPSHTPTGRPTAGQISPLQPYPFPIVTGSKLSIHVIRNNNRGIMEFVRQAQPSTIKLVDDLGFATDIKEASPNTIVVGRVDQLDQRYLGSPEDAARRYVDTNLRKYLLNTGVDFWEGWNEPDPNLENMWWYTRFEQERVRYMAQYGLRSAIGGFATGVPEMDEFAQFVPAIETAIQYGGILTLHEYGAPEMTYLFGSALPGYPAYADRGALTFRYRWYYREFLEPAGLVIPLVITEAGIDGIIGNRPGPDGYGWQDFTDYAIAQGWGETGEDAFINQLAWYDRGVRQDYYVLGFTIFTAGPVGHWYNYDINPLLPRLTDYVNGQKQP